jgi:hypothetical protein
VFGIAVCRAALGRPVATFWVWLTVAYAFAVAVFEVVAHFTIGRYISLAPIVFGLLSGALLLALLYPQQRPVPESPTEPETAAESTDTSRESTAPAAPHETENLR